MVRPSVLLATLVAAILVNAVVCEDKAGDAQTERFEGRSGTLAQAAVRLTGDPADKSSRPTFQMCFNAGGPRNCSMFWVPDADALNVSEFDFRCRSDRKLRDKSDCEEKKRIASGVDDAYVKEHPETLELLLTLAGRTLRLERPGTHAPYFVKAATDLAVEVQPLSQHSMGVFRGPGPVELPIGGVAAFTAEFQAAHGGVVFELCSRRANFTCHRLSVTAFEEGWLKYQQTREATKDLAVQYYHSDPIYSWPVPHWSELPPGPLKFAVSHANSSSGPRLSVWLLSPRTAAANCSLVDADLDTLLVRPWRWTKPMPVKFVDLSVPGELTDQVNAMLDKLRDGDADLNRPDAIGNAGAGWQPTGVIDLKPQGPTGPTSVENLV